MARTEQEYVTNTAVLVTRLYDNDGGTVEITDCVPRFHQHGRMFHPMTLVRRVRRLAGSPRIAVRLRPAAAYGAARPQVTVGSNHIRYVTPDVTLRLTTDASLTAILEERPFFLDDDVTLLLGPDETVPDAVAEIGRRFIEETIAYWRDWVRRLAIPFEWQEAVIRAAITLQQNAYDDTGAIVAAMTTSIPEAPDSGRNWDYRYCWLRDGYFVVDALNRLGATETMERYLGYIVNIAAGAGDGTLQPVYRISGDAALAERVVDVAAGLSRHGAGARRQRRRPAGAARRLRLGDPRRDARVLRRAAHPPRRPGAVRAAGSARPPRASRCSTSPTRASGNCAAARACTRSRRDVLGRVRPSRADRGEGRARRSRAGLARRRRAHRALHRRALLERAARHASSRTVDGDTLDASLLLLAELGFVAPDDPRFAGTVRAIERELKRGDFIFRYVENDDFGAPQNAFVVCTFWYVNALAAARPPRRGARAVRAAARLPQPARPVRRASRPRDRRALGQLRADLQHGRAHHLRDPAVGAVGRGVLTAPAASRQGCGACSSEGSTWIVTCAFARCAVSAASIRSHSSCESTTLMAPGTSR